MPKQNDRDGEEDLLGTAFTSPAVSALCPLPSGSAGLCPRAFGLSKLTPSARPSGCSSHESAPKGLHQQGGRPAWGALTALCSDHASPPAR